MGALPPRAGSCPRIPPEFAAIEVPTARRRSCSSSRGPLARGSGWSRRPPGREPHTCTVVRRWRARGWKYPAVLAMVGAGVPAAQAARFGYAGGWTGRMLSAFAQ